ncbi:MAG: hypothetical protein J0H69_00795 [Burkholderiales bacterium]|jgi:hypothetical protein|nr:hypothetical protein [Burkholderiales bacterium]
MASEKTLARLDTLIWVLIYGGLFTLVLGLAGWRNDAAADWPWLCVTLGPAAALAGAVMVWVRSRLRGPDA